ncbi:MAG: prephenate dehydrogenase/arogenate dehydrogenase family protein [Candidatus Eisenbacteria sp.]|nr:prephenate dehydrogenase/arogenate dehydrogenase family protein [Candidatus Eisenbacteria bacterium]
MSTDIEHLRQEIAGLDLELLENLRRRFELAAQVGTLKAKDGQPVVVREVQERVLQRAREAAKTCETSPEVMEAIFAAIIRGSIERQYRDRLEAGARAGRKILIIGAAGAMGKWLCHFLGSMGHNPVGLDTAWGKGARNKNHCASLEEIPDLAAFDAVFVSVPLETTPNVLSALAEASLPIPVIEIASIKDHLKEALAALRHAGTPVLSLHPMFGPGKNIFEPLTVVHAVVNNEAAERARILDLLAHPYLDLVSLPFDHHDRVMGWLLGLAHLTGMLFASALSRSGLDPKEMERVASTTFARQASTARSILEEDPQLYFAIQHLNPFRGEVYSALTAALGDLTGAVERDDSKAFAEIIKGAASMLPGK